MQIILDALMDVIKITSVTTGLVLLIIGANLLRKQLFATEKDRAVHRNKSSYHLN